MKNQNSVGLSVKDYPIYTLFIVSLIVIQSVFVLTVTVMFQKIVDKLEIGPFTNILFGILVYFILETILLAINNVFSIFACRVRSNICMKLRNRLFFNLLETANPKQISEKGKEYFISMMTQDMKKYSNDFLNSQISLLQTAVRLLSLNGILFYYHWLLGSGLCNRPEV